MIGTAIRSQARAGFGDSPESVMRLFAGIVMEIRNEYSNPITGADENSMASAIAHYYLSMKNKSDAAAYGLPFTSNFRALVSERGFDNECSDAPPISTKNGIAVFPPTGDSSFVGNLDLVNKLRDDDP